MTRRGRRAYLNAEEIEQLEGDYQMIRDADSSVPEEEKEARNGIVEKFGLRVSDYASKSGGAEDG